MVTEFEGLINVSRERKRTYEVEAYGLVPQYGCEEHRAPSAIRAPNDLKGWCNSEF
jgi:hypothetical protein